MAATRRRRTVLLKRVVGIFERVRRQAAEGDRTHAAYVYPRSAVVAHLACMRAAGWKDADYEDLMALSGFGFSFAYHHRDLFWVSYVPPPGADDRIARATGFGWEWLFYGSVEAYWDALKETLNARRPVRAPYFEDLVFAGYREADDREDRRVFAVCDPFAWPGKWWTWRQFREWFNAESRGALGRHTGKVRKVAAKRMALEVMRTLVDWADEHPLAEAYPRVRFGLAGIRAYAADAADLFRTERHFQTGWMGGRAIYPQWTARRAAAVYLDRAASRFTGKAKERLRAAAERYRRAFAAWQEWEKHLGREGVAPEDAWRNKHHRRAGAAAVLRALEHEEAAVAEVKKSLRAAK